MMVNATRVIKNQQAIAWKVIQDSSRVVQVGQIKGDIFKRTALT
jgi:hypothetical protein